MGVRLQIDFNLDAHGLEAEHMCRSIIKKIEEEYPNITFKGFWHHIEIVN